MEELEQWNEATNKVAEKFIQTYFDKETDWDWVEQDTGVMLTTGDLFFDFKDMLFALQNDVSYEDLNEYYEIAYTEFNELHEGKRKTLNYPDLRSYVRRATLKPLS